VHSLSSSSFLACNSKIALSSMHIICPNRVSQHDWFIAVSLGWFVREQKWFIITCHQRLHKPVYTLRNISRHMTDWWTRQKLISSVSKWNQLVAHGEVLTHLYTLVSDERETQSASRSVYRRNLVIFQGSPRYYCQTVTRTSQYVTTVTDSLQLCPYLLRAYVVLTFT